MDGLARQQPVAVYLEQLFHENVDRLACILFASLNDQGTPLPDLEAGGFLGGTASTIMVHDGDDHLVQATGRPRRVGGYASDAKAPHIHVWPPPADAVAWVHTHHPLRGTELSSWDIAVAEKMKREHQIDLPLIVLTKASISAYWHGRTWRSVLIAGHGWFEGTDVGSCPTVYRQP